MSVTCPRLPEWEALPVTKPPPTFVSAYLEIPSNRGRRDPEIYLNFFFPFTASIPQPLVVFVEEKNAARVREQLLRYFPHPPEHFDKYRQIRRREISELPTNCYREKLQTCAISPNIGRPADADCAVVLLAKTFFLQEVMADNPFHSQHFGWLDFGVRHALHWEHTCWETFVASIGDPVRFSILNFLEPGLLQERKKYYQHNRYLLAGAIVTGGQTALEEFCLQVPSEIEAMLAEGCYGVEEQVWGLILHRQLARYDFVFGDYDHCLANVGRIQGNFARVCEVLRQCRQYGYFRCGCQIIYQLLRGLAENYEPARELMANALYNGFVCAYYVKGAREFAEYLADILCLLYSSSTCIRNNLADKGRVQASLRFLSRDLDSPRWSLQDLSPEETHRWIRIW